MNNIVRNIPNTITCLNLAAGCMALICANAGTRPFWGGMPGFEWAFIFIAIGALADFLDGFAARLLHAYSNLGKELDSLCDLVTFGVAPALTLFRVLEDAGACWLAWTVLLIPVAGAIRLARFNIDPRQTTVFIGLPIPANAIFWIGYTALICPHGALSQGIPFLTQWYVFLPFLVVECWLMNSPLRMFSLKIKNFSWKGNMPQLLLILAAGISCFTLGVGGLFWLIIFYVLLSVAFKAQ